MEKVFLLLSIKKKFAELIKEGKKTWEYRKVVPTKDVVGIVFYCPEEKDFSSLHSKVSMQVGTPAEISEKCVDQKSLVPSLLRYFGDRSKVVAYKLEKNRILCPGVKSKLEEKLGQPFRAPQGFIYIDSTHPLNNILELNL